MKVMGKSGCGVVRIRTVRMRKEGHGEGSSVGGVVVRDMPNSTTGFVELYLCNKSVAVI